MKENVSWKRSSEYETPLDDLYRDFRVFVRSFGMGRFGSLSAEAADSKWSGDDRRPGDNRGGRSLRWAECLAGNGRDASRVDLGTWQLRGARLDCGLFASRGALYFSR